VKAIQSATADDITIAGLLWAWPKVAAPSGLGTHAISPPSTTTNAVDLFNNVYVPDNSATQLLDSGFRATVTAAVGAPSLTTFETKLALTTRRKGTVTSYFHPITGSPVLDDCLSDSGATWYKNYMAGPDLVNPASDGTDFGGHPVTISESTLEFFPILQTMADLNATNYALAASHNTIMQCGNELDSQGVSVATFMTKWPEIVATGLNLTSPLTTQANTANHASGWFHDFANDASHPLDDCVSITAQWYTGTFTDPLGQRAALKSYLDTINSFYGKDVILTEFGMIGFTGSNAELWNYPTYQQAADFLRACAPMLNSLTYLKRWAWFALGHSRAGGNHIGQYTHEGYRTLVGEAYKYAPG
jgi:hypothetical protein